MNEPRNPECVNPHFQNPLHPLNDRNLQHPDVLPVPTVSTGAQPCPSCGHCPTCGRGPSWPVYWRSTWWNTPHTSITLSSGTEPTTTQDA